MTSSGRRCGAAFGRLVVGLATAFALALAGCGGKEGDAPETSRVSQAEVEAQDAPVAKPAEGEAGRSATERLPGRWGPLPGHLRRRAEVAEQQRMIAELEAIGYASGSARPAGLAGVTRHDPSRSAPGLNFVTSGHAPGADLVDAEGRVVHRWEKAFRDVWPDAENVQEEYVRYWRRARLLPDGDVLAIFTSQGIVRIDRDSRVVWAVRNGAHHDIDLDDEGRIWLLTRKIKLIPRLNASRPYLEDFVVLLSPEGETLREISVYQSLERSRWAERFAEALRAGGDALHTNTVSWLDGRGAEVDPAFARGNLLVSSYYLHFIAVLDPAREEIVWLRDRDHRFQHDPQLIDEARILVFDNRGARGRSRVMEIDLASDEIVWQYAHGADAPFFSATCGAVQRLPGGNTLVSETDGGRAFEITRDGEIVWEYVNPQRAGADDEYIASLFEVWRLPPGFPLGWLPESESSQVGAAADAERKVTEAKDEPVRARAGPAGEAPASRP